MVPSAVIVPVSESDTASTEFSDSNIKSRDGAVASPVAPIVSDAAALYCRTIDNKVVQVLFAKRTHLTGDCAYDVVRL